MLACLALAAVPEWAQESSSQKCLALMKNDGKQFPNPATRLDSAVYNQAQPAKGNTPGAPEHCEVIGRINDRIGFNSQRFAIRFHLRLPAQWNGGFFFGGGGGSNGSLGTAMGNLQGSQKGTALGLGYAVVTQDAGHDNDVNNDPNLNGTAVYAFDPQARLDQGYNSYDQVTQAAKALVRLYYGRAPGHSYFAGCSEGGREALLMAQKYPEYFDGILACAPGIRIPKAVLGQVWNFQTLASVAKNMGVYDRDGVPFVNKTLSDEDLALAAAAVLEACDSLDGVKDGISANFPECNAAAVHPRLLALTCKGPKRSSCLSASQVSALERIMGGPRDAKGEPEYSDWAWDSGIGGKTGDQFFQGWRAWSIGSYEATSVSAIVTSLVATSTAAGSAPPEPLRAFGPDAARYLMSFELDAPSEKMHMTNATYRTSTWDLMDVGGTNLTAFKSRGGKLLMAHGVSDPIFSVKDSIAWWNDVNRAYNGTAAEFVRLFAVPGMNHCAGGPATDQFDAFGALVGWVEKGAAPERIVATAGSATPWPGRTRPLCVWPRIARYKGSGNLEDAANFVCQ